MPDRDKLKEGDTAFAVFFNGVFTYTYGTVIKTDEGLAITNQYGLIGYLKDADEVREAIVQDGNLFTTYEFKKPKENLVGTFLIAIPILQDGKLDLSKRPQDYVIPEPEHLNPTEQQKLKQIAKKLNAQLY